MKILLLISLLFSYIYGFNQGEQSEIKNQSDSVILGKWTNKRVQVQYVVDSHLVHEEEVAEDKGKVYNFDKTIVRIENPDGTTVQGRYLIMMEDNQRKLILQLPGYTVLYNLISVTSTSMVWQKDLEETSYTEGNSRKSAERAIYTEEFTR